MVLFYWHQNLRWTMYQYNSILLAKVNVFYSIKTNKITSNFYKNPQIHSVSIKQNKISLTKRIKLKDVFNQLNICPKIFSKIHPLTKKHKNKSFFKENKLYIKLLVSKTSKNYNFCKRKNNTVMNSHFFCPQIFHHQ